MSDEPNVAAAEGTAPRPSESTPSRSRSEAVVQWLGWALIVAALVAYWLG